MKILVLDNYDSFTFNLVQLLRECSGTDPIVYRNDKISLEDVGAFDKIVLSPGPGLPHEAGILIPLIREYASKRSILGVCLGHQGIAEALGGKLLQAPELVHGKAREIEILKKRDRLYDGLPPRFAVGRYHSWIVDPATLPPELVVTARDEQGNIMSLAHESFDLHGVQYHPESVLTEHGREILINWLKG